MGSEFEVTVKFSSTEDAKDFTSPEDAVKMFLYYGSRYQDHGYELRSTILVTEVECIHSENGKHFTFEDEGDEIYWEEGEDFDGNPVRVQECFNCGQDVEEAIPYDTEHISLRTE